MGRIKQIIFFILIGLSVIGIPVFTFGIINTMVSRKYETNDMADCISLVTGQDLCLIIVVLKGLIIVCITIIILLVVFKKRFFKV